MNEECGCDWYRESDFVASTGNSRVLATIAFGGTGGTLFLKSRRGNLAMAAFAVLVVAYGLTYRLRQVEVIVPDGFSGPIVIIQSDRGSIAERSRSRVRFIIPQSGILYVTDSEVFGNTTWHVKRASGQPVPVDYDVDPFETAFRFGGSSTGEGPDRLEFFIGTEKEYSEFDFPQLTRRLTDHP